jgi:hypothetical protein
MRFVLRDPVRARDQRHLIDRLTGERLLIERERVAEYARGMSERPDAMRIVDAEAGLLSAIEVHHDLRNGLYKVGDRHV